MVQREAVLEKLEGVIDPELRIDIVSLGLVYDIDIDGDAVKINMTLTSPGCPAGPLLKREAEDAVMQLDGVATAAVMFVWDPIWGPELMSDEAKLELGFAI